MADMCLKPKYALKTLVYGIHIFHSIGLFQNMVLVKKQSKTLQHVQSESIDACLLMLPL